MWRYLSQHPDIYMTRLAKEPHFFLWSDEVHNFEYGDWKRIEKAYHHDWESYLALFEDSTKPVRGEASVFYLPHPTAPVKIISRCPDARIVISLRNPVDRAFSWYRFNRMRHEESAATFRGAIEKELACRNPYYAGQYIGLGRYFEQVSRYLETFGRDRVKVVFFDDLEQDAAAVCSNIFSFLGVRADCRIDTDSRHNPTLDRHPTMDLLYRLKASKGPAGTMARSVHGLLTRSTSFLRAKNVVLGWVESKGGDVEESLARAPNSLISPEDRAYALELLRADILRLEQLLDRDLRHWHTIRGSTEL